MPEFNYWQLVAKRNLSRRKLLRTTTAVGLGVAAGGLVACNPSSATTTPATSQGGIAPTPAVPELVGLKYLANAPSRISQPKLGGKAVFVNRNVPPHLDPIESNSVATLYAGAVVYNRLIRLEYGAEMSPFNTATIKLAPDLAQSWQFNADSTELTLKLTPGVKWQNVPPVNGREFTAEDVKYSLEKYAKGATTNALFSTLDSVTVVDKGTVRIKLNQPYPEFIFTPLAESQIMMLPREIEETYGDFKNHAIGTGPFILKEYTPKERTTYVKNPDYFRRGRPYLDELQLDFVTEEAARLAGFRSGQFDAGRLNLGLEEDRQALLRSNPDTVIYEIEPTWPAYNVAVRLDKAPFNDVRVRRALSLAIDRPGIAKSVYGGRALNVAPLPWPHFWDERPGEKELGPYYSYNVEAAKKLLAEAGFSNGLRFQFEYYSYGSDVDAMIQLLQQQWKAIGVEARLTQLEYASFLQKYTTGKFEEVTLGHYSPYLISADGWTHVRMHSRSDGNYWRINDPELDKLLEAQRRESDRIKRREILRQIWARDSDNMYRISLPTYYSYQAHRPHLQNFLSTSYVDLQTFGGSAWELVWLNK